MRVVIQRVSHANVEVDGLVVGNIDHGLLLLIGIASDEDEQYIQKFVRKIVNMRIFNDEEGKMNKSIVDIEGNILSVSQFTLYGDCKKGNRPSFVKAAKPDVAEHLYDVFNKVLEEELGRTVQKGIFGADMKVSLLNDGPVTIILDSDSW